MLDLTTTLMFLSRWIHFIAGILWIGLLYFFNFVNIPLGSALDADSRRRVTPELMPRALFFFRWGAMLTFLSGWTMIVIKYFVVGSGMTGPSGMMTTPGGLWISFGMLFGTIMWFNVWFIIWPAQKQILPRVKLGEAAPPRLPARAARASRVNTYLSVPLLFFMGAGSEGHYPIFNYPTLIAVLVVGFLIVKGLYGLSTRVKGV